MTYYQTDRHHVYRLFDRDGELLYIGATSNIGSRLNDYRRNCVWWHRVGFVDSDEYPTRAEAFAAEAAAIREHQPELNTQSKRGTAA